MIRKYIVSFGSIFADVHVVRKDTTVTPNTINDIRVPIGFGTKSKMSWMKNQNNSNYQDKLKLAAILPRMGFNLTSIDYDSMRKLNSLNTIAAKEKVDFSEEILYSGVPYNFNFTLSIWTKHLDDMFQIVEQTTSFFKPDYCVTVNEIPEFNISRDVPISISSTNLNFENEYDEGTYRNLFCDIDFTLKGWIYPPIKDTKIITVINSRIKDSDTKKTFATIRHKYDESSDLTITDIAESIDADFDDLESSYDHITPKFEQGIPTYVQESEPDMGTFKTVLWVDPINKYKKVLIQLNSSGTKTYTDIEV